MFSNEATRNTKKADLVSKRNTLAWASEMRVPVLTGCETPAHFPRKVGAIKQEERLSSVTGRL